MPHPVTAARAAGLMALVAGLAGCGAFDQVPSQALTACQQGVFLPAQVETDMLFVIDDSGSMDPMQANLAANFDAFIDQLATTQATRASNGLDPLSFHIAITTSSIFFAATGTCGAGLTCTTNPLTASACGSQGASCVGIRDSFYQCGAPKDGTPFPAGDFVAAGSNPRVLHFAFTPSQWATWATASVDPALQAAVDRFKQNVVVGSCGSGEEQHLEASRLALQKALAGAQPGVAPGEWPHPGSKIVVVWLGNEDDCSNPEDPARAIPYSGNPGSDGCTAEQLLPPAQQRLLPVSGYTSFLASLGRQVAAAFIYPGSTVAGSFVPGACTCQVGGCAGYGPGTRFKAMADGLRAQGSTVVEASVCDASFAGAVQGIAALLDPGQTVPLDGTPADWRLLVVGLARADGTRVGCPVGLPGDASAGVIYEAPQAGREAALTFQGSCQVHPGDQIEIRVICAG